MIFRKLRPLHLLQGERAEQQACDFLLKQGLKLVDKNFRCQWGEIDLIMQERETLVVVEVRFRKSAHYGGALESITAKKQSRIIATTQYYIQRHPVNSTIRFDVVALSADKGIHWIKNAFQT